MIDPDSPYFNKKEKNKNKKWYRSEKKVSEDFHGRMRSGSGNSPLKRFKGDVVCEEFLFEVKSTSKKSFSLKEEILAKITEEAEAQSKTPALVIDFVKERECYNEKWIAVPYSFFKEKIVGD